MFRHKFFGSLLLGAVLAITSTFASARDPWSIEAVANSDIAAIARRTDTICVELAKSVSGRVMNISDFDLARYDAYAVELDSLVSWVYADPGVDLPHVDETGYSLDYKCDDLDLELVENMAVQDLLTMYLQMQYEFTASNSADHSNGLQDPDYTRYTLLRDKIARYLDSYVRPVQDIDIPESTTKALENDALNAASINANTPILGKRIRQTQAQ